MALVVQKYGGTSVADTDRIKNVARRVIARKKQGDDVVVVLSAMAGQTNHLIELARQVQEVPDPRELDVLLATGEQVTIALFSMAVKEMGLDAVSFLGFQVPIETDPSHGKARIIQIPTDKVKRELDHGRIVVIAGFQGITPAGSITTLGRGGSDTTAVAVAVALGADVC
jgi:aspartate kinase